MFTVRPSTPQALTIVAARGVTVVISVAVLVPLAARLQAPCRDIFGRGVQVACTR